MSPFLCSSLFCLCFIVFQFLLHISLNLSGWTQPRIWALVNYHWSKISPTLPGMLYLRHPCACDVRAPNKREQNVKLYLRISQTSFSCSSPPPSPALSSSSSCTSGTLQTQLPQSWKLHMWRPFHSLIERKYASDFTCPWYCGWTLAPCLCPWEHMLVKNNGCSK